MSKASSYARQQARYCKEACTIVKFINFVLSPRRKFQLEFSKAEFKQQPWCMICNREQHDAESYVD